MKLSVIVPAYNAKKTLCTTINSIIKQSFTDWELIIINDGSTDDTLAKEKIIFMGKCNDVASIYMAMDIVVFPSRFEGLPIALLEAQFAGLSCLISDSISDEVILTDAVQALPLNMAPTIWAETILKIELKDREKFYEENFEKIEKYDIINCAKELEKKYLSM